MFSLVLFSYHWFRAYTFALFHSFSFDIKPFDLWSAIRLLRFEMFFPHRRSARQGAENVSFAITLCHSVSRESSPTWRSHPATTPEPSFQPSDTTFNKRTTISPGTPVSFLVQQKAHHERVGRRNGCVSFRREKIPGK